MCILLVLSVSVMAEEISLVREKQTCAIYVDKDANQTVQVAAELLAGDIERVSNRKPAITHEFAGSETVIVIGEIGKCPLLKSLASKHSVSVDEITGTWERYLHATVLDPAPGVKKALIVAGSDRRGTAYGALEISRMIGVSPWYWWADVTPPKQSELVLCIPDKVSPGPAVKYRGIFINDEDVCLVPWACNYFDENTLGPKAYEQIFELMLRLRANYIWPGMHNYFGRAWLWEPLPRNNEPFHYVHGNREMADKYGIIVGSSHCEPLHRNPMYEWGAEHPGEKYGYHENTPLFLGWLKTRVLEAKAYEAYNGRVAAQCNDRSKKWR